LRDDLDENKELYGRQLTGKQILSGEVEPPESANRLSAFLNKYSRVEQGGERARKP
jgi:lipid-binding SYLF domain-containing protein